jgi:alkanesulfonate monooxygenase SsuD/methylene tetrahydromethanopterin reductase-like flavin-dependent oxidoreductase (luciferase family)
MRFAIRVPAVGPAASVDRLIETTREAEALGWDAVMVTDHIHKSFEKHRSSPPASGWFKDTSNTPDPVLFEAVTTLAFLGGMTSSIELGVGVMALPLRDPAVLAKELSTLDALSRGRVIVGVGVSNVTDRPEYEALGRPFLPYAERYAQIGEKVLAMRRIWEETPASFHGRYVDFDGLIVFPKPARRIPIWVGCGSLSKGPDHPAVRFTLDHADGWLFPFLADPGEIAVMISDFRRTAGEVGRDLSGFDYCVQRRISLGETEAEAHENVDWVVTEQTDMWRWAGYMQAQGEAGYTANLANVSLGTPDDMCRMVEGYADAGATMIEIVPAFATYDQLLRQVRLFGREVLPAFR